MKQEQKVLILNSSFTNSKSNEETEDNKQPVGMWKSTQKTEQSDDATIRINGDSSAQLVSERTNCYSTQEETQEYHRRRHGNVYCFVADKIKLEIVKKNDQFKVH